MRSLLSTAALAAALVVTPLSLGYAQSVSEPSVSEPNTPGTNPGESVVDTSTSTGSIVGDRSTGGGQSMHEAQDDSDASPSIAQPEKSPCPSGLGTGNGDCR